MTKGESERCVVFNITESLSISGLFSQVGPTLHENVQISSLTTFFGRVCWLTFKEDNILWNPISSCLQQEFRNLTIAFAGKDCATPHELDTRKPGVHLH